MTNADIQKVLDYHRQRSGGRTALNAAGAARVLRESGAATADDYIRQCTARAADRADAFESLSRLPSNSGVAANGSFGGQLPPAKP
ncbi:MAG TPA: hypothetical protein VFN09_04915 [Rhodanobacteraceae bacterium]|nr:hypothetical protein [Rhodanobacteraceae bacterium]